MVECALAFVPATAPAAATRLCLHRRPVCVGRPRIARVPHRAAARARMTADTPGDASPDGASPDDASPDDASAAPTDESTPAAPTTDSVPEPYPGFYADMSRMGMTDEQAVAQALKQSSSTPGKGDSGASGKPASNLFRPDGTAYAPWMADTPSADPASSRQRSADAQRVTAERVLDNRLVTFKKVGDDLELLWTTSGEEGNIGFVVYRRLETVPEWTKVSDFRDSLFLKSKGAAGGSYSFMVEDPLPGAWIYRVSDVDAQSNVTDLSQLPIEIESPEGARLQKIALGVLLAILAVSVIIGLSVDPQSL